MNKALFLFLFLVPLSYSLSAEQAAALNSATNTSLFFADNNYYNVNQTFNKTEIAQMLDAYANKTDLPKYYNRTEIDEIRAGQNHEIESAKSIVTVTVQDIIRNETREEMIRQNITFELFRIEEETIDQFANYKRDYVSRADFAEYRNKTLDPFLVAMQLEYRQDSRNQFYMILIAAGVIVAFGLALYKKDPKFYYGSFLNEKSAMPVTIEEITTNEEWRKKTNHYRNLEMKIIMLKENVEIKKLLLQDLYDRIIMDEDDIQTQLKYHKTKAGEKIEIRKPIPKDKPRAKPEAEEAVKPAEDEPVRAVKKSTRKWLRQH